MTVSAILQMAEAQGIEYLGITDHIFAVTDPSILKSVADELANLPKPMNVYLGCEADILAVGKHTVTEEMKSTLDYIAVSANHYQLEWVSHPESDSPEALGKHYLDMFRYACSLDFADIICHPMQVVCGDHDPQCLETLRDKDVMEAIELARANSVAIEISPRLLSNDPEGFTFRFYRMCKETGVKFSFGSDAHALHNVGTTSIMEEFVRSMGITDEDVWLPAGGARQ